MASPERLKLSVQSKAPSTPGEDILHIDASAKEPPASTASLTQDSFLIDIIIKRQPTDLMRLPDDALFEILKYLRPQHAIPLALTCHRLHDVVSQAYKKPLRAIFSRAPSSLPVGTVWPSKLLHIVSPDALRLLRMARAQNSWHTNLFRKLLRGFFGDDLVYCGLDGMPMMARLQPESTFKAHEHTDCNCKRSLAMRRDELERTDADHQSASERAAYTRMAQDMIEQIESARENKIRAERLHKEYYNDF